jgi:hypothetical protein
MRVLASDSPCAHHLLAGWSTLLQQWGEQPWVPCAAD